MQMQHAQSLPFASSLCGACYEVCPVKINIPEVLIDLRAQVTDQERKHDLGRFFDPMYLGMRAPIFFSRAWLFTPRSSWAASDCASFHAQRRMDSLAAQHRREVDPDPRSARPAQSRPSTSGGRRDTKEAK
jgi:L-lactate utilization protein LutB